VLLFLIGVESSPHVLFEEAWRYCQAKRQNKEFLIQLCYYTVPEEQTVSKFEISKSNMPGKPKDSHYAVSQLHHMTPLSILLAHF